MTTPPPVTAPSPWFLFPDRPDAEIALYCVPHSGGGASAFRPWLDAVPDRIACRPLQLPGRESRMGEPPTLDVAELARVVAADATRPFALYGHSLGALLAFEVVRELDRIGARLPTRLFVGACRPPATAAEVADDLLEMPDREFLTRLVDMGGTHPALVEQPELAALFLPVLRSDFGWIRGYRPPPDAVVPVPIVAFTGRRDAMVTPEAVRGWSRYTSAGFRLHEVDGGHFFLTGSLDRVVGEIAGEVLGEP